MALEGKVRLTLEDKVSNKLKAIQNTFNKTSQIGKSISSTMGYWPQGLQRTITQAKKLQSEFKKNNTLVEEFSRKLRGIVSAYGGVMTIKAIVQTSDTITGAENRLNYANGGDTAATEQSMDKIYAASQRARADYADMLGNVGKSMALAGDTAFQGNIDNAIAFQEIMAKSYALGGASAAEQSSSMYQMVQALGSGILQGDELRSVREGAPLAYKEIEKFAQGVLNSNESLKELASQGKITSDIVVAAMLNAGDSIDEAFEKTDMTIAQAFTSIKNTATNSMRSVQDTINSFLNSETGAKVIEGISIAIQGLIGVLNILLQVGISVLTWMVNNWSWLQYIVYAVAAAIIYLAVVAIGQTLWKAMLLIFTNPFVLWMMAIGMVIAGIVYLANTAKDGCEFIYNVCYILAMAIVTLLAVVLAVYIATGVIMLSIPTLIVLTIIALVALLVMAIAKYGEQIGGFIGGLVASIIAIVGNAIGLIQKVISALKSWIGAVCTNIGIFFSNLWSGATAAFWDFIYNVLSGIADLEPAFNALAKLFGLEGVTLSGLTTTAKGKADAARSNIQSYVSLSDAWNSGYAAPGEYNNISDAWDKGSAIGSKIGASVQNGINNAFDKAKSGISSLKTGVTDKINDALNIDKTFDKDSPENQLATTMPDLTDGVGNIDKNTGKMADSMEMAEEDLELLRSLAEMEWKKEFTTANITVDMTNNNTINNAGDLDGWFGAFTDRLSEELQMVADGVY